jgi:hypothetical protein
MNRLGVAVSAEAIMLSACASPRDGRARVRQTDVDPLSAANFQHSDAGDREGGTNKNRED